VNFAPPLAVFIRWLTPSVKCGIKTVAIESTGAYWIAVHEIREERRLEVVLVNAHHIHNERGLKTDVKDCQGLQEFYSVRLLQASFGSTAENVALRSYVAPSPNRLTPLPPALTGCKKP
jgi:hypothetical protein